MAKDVQQVTAVRQGYQVRRGAVKCESGLSTRYVATAIYDTAANDRAGVSNKTVAAHPLGVYIPSGAIITKAIFQTKTGFTSAANTATVAISAQGANDLVTAAAVSGAGFNVAGLTTGIPDGTVTNSIILTAEREITATVAVQALTAGKLVIFIEYIIGL